MLIMKFGGASVKDAASVRNVVEIILTHNHEPCVIVISAMDKITNELEKLAKFAADGNKKAAITQFLHIQNFHYEIVEDLFGDEADKQKGKLEPYLQEIQQLVEGLLMIGEFPPLMYDRIVAFGELISTQIVANYLIWLNGKCQWVDARTLIKTDMQHGQAKVIWSVTQETITKELGGLAAGLTIITQGFIASTLNGKTTTLGREGSDYTAAILANCLNAETMIVWKDVPGILNADPKRKSDAIKIDKLSYEQAVEMTFYGATVIHPKTIQPLYIKKIPLLVKSFKDMHLPGTCISTEPDVAQTPTYIHKQNQSVIRLIPRDFSFMDEALVQHIFNEAHRAGLKINLSQTAAISLYIGVDNNPNAIRKFEGELLDSFQITIEHGYALDTILNYTAQDKQQAENAPWVQFTGNKLCKLSAL